MNIKPDVIEYFDSLGLNCLTEVVQLSDKLLLKIFIKVLIIKPWWVCCVVTIDFITSMDQVNKKIMTMW